MSSNVSNESSRFTSLNENDPLHVFLRSQHECIRGNVDEFYTWLVKSEYIDSMTTLKEAVSKDDYLNNNMKRGCGGSGLKAFQLSTFKQVVQEYVEEDNGDTNNEKRVISPSRSVQQEKSGHKRSHDDLVDTPPAKKTKKKSSKSSRRIISEDEEEDEDQVAAKPRESKKRKLFTEVEDAAIRLGVERFGAGNWVQIKAYYQMELIDRTNINIKDRWRTWNK